MTWSHPATVNIFATSFAVMGARDLSFLSMRAYGKHGMTAVIRRADAVLHAEMRIRSSMRLSLTSLHPDWMMKTSSSLTDSEILMLVSPLENFLTVQGTRGTPSLGCEQIDHQSVDCFIGCNSWRGSSPLRDGLGEFGVTVPCETKVRKESKTSGVKCY